VTEIIPALFDAAAVALIGGISYLIHVGRRVSRTSRVMFRDWEGEPARPGVKRRPGVMERIEAVEEGIAEIRHEVKPNSGTSMRDSVARIHQATTGEPDPGGQQ
jgi:hypothetical protein